MAMSVILQLALLPIGGCSVSHPEGKNISCIAGFHALAFAFFTRYNIRRKSDIYKSNRGRVMNEIESSLSEYTRSRAAQYREFYSATGHTAAEYARRRRGRRPRCKRANVIKLHTDAKLSAS
jgi:hypothetical protein